MKRFCALLMIISLMLLTGCKGDAKNTTSSGSIDVNDPLTSYSNACYNLYKTLLSNRVLCNATSSITTASQNTNQTVTTGAKMTSDLTTDAYKFCADINSYVLDEANYIAAKSVIADIEALPSSEDVTSADTDTVKGVREEYNKLSAAGRYEVNNYDKLTTIEEKLGISVEAVEVIDGTSGGNAAFCDGSYYYVFVNPKTYKMPIVDGVRAEILKSLYYDLPVEESEIKAKTMEATKNGYNFKFEITPALVNENMGTTILAPFGIPFDSATFSSVSVEGTIDSQGVIATYKITATGTATTSENPINFIIDTNVSYDPLETDYKFEKPSLIEACTNVVELTYDEMKNSSSSATE